MAFIRFFNSSASYRLMSIFLQSTKEILMIFLEIILLFGCIIYAAKLGGIGVGMAGGLGMAIAVFVLGLKPGAIPIDVILIILSVIFAIIFMVYNAIAQSAQPIISYNFGAGQPDRVRKALHLAIRTALICGISFFIITFLCRQNIVSLFIDRSCPAFDIAVNGIPYFGVGFIFFAANMIGIGYYQSIGRGQRATIITLLRGVVFMLIGFFVLPLVLGVPGIWLAVPLAELLTTLYIIGIYFKDRFMVHRL